MRRAARAAALLLALGSLGACVSISPRAIQNGQALSRSGAFQRAMRGDHSLATQRKLYLEADPIRSMYRPAPYAPFGRWDY